MTIREAIAKATASKLYAPVAVGVSVAVGVCAGIFAEKVHGKRLENAGDPAAEYPDIPEGVNLVDEDEPEVMKVEEPAELFRKPDMSQYVNYASFHAKPEAHVEKGPEITLISEDEFVRGTGNLDGYVSVTGTYFTEDGILAGWNDELEEKIPENSVGTECLDAFDDPTVKSVYVRNDDQKILFEVVRCDEPYDSVKAETLGETS